MPRITPAAKQFISEVQSVDEDVTARASGEPDGLGVHRSVSFHGASDWLGDVLRSMWNEPRLQKWDMDGDDIVLTFVSTARADFRHEFGVKAAAEIIRGKVTEGGSTKGTRIGGFEPPQGDEVDLPPVKKVAKKTAKKAAKKAP